MERLLQDDDGSGCEVHEFPNSCAVEVLAEFGYTPEAFDATNVAVDKDRIRKHLKDRTEWAQVGGAGHSPSLQLIVLNEDQIEEGIEEIVLEAGFKKLVHTYAASYQNYVALYAKCAWESREQALEWLKAKYNVQKKSRYKSKVTREDIEAAVVELRKKQGVAKSKK